MMKKMELDDSVGIAEVRNVDEGSHTCLLKPMDSLIPALAAQPPGLLPRPRSQRDLRKRSLRDRASGRLLSEPGQRRLQRIAVPILLCTRWSTQPALWTRLKMGAD